MPTYVYECSACGVVFEADQRISEEPLTTCQNCKAEGKVKRVIQPVGVMFKGQGFHINDYASKPTPPESSATKEAAPPKPEAAPSPAAPVSDGKTE